MAITATSNPPMFWSLLETNQLNNHNKVRENIKQKRDTYPRLSDREIFSLI